MPLTIVQLITANQRFRNQPASFIFTKFDHFKLCIGLHALDKADMLLTQIWNQPSSLQALSNA